jgi:pimeloyl-ACP methyl ester carboxylesterase
MLERFEVQVGEYTITGRRRPAAYAVAGRPRPLIVALHGGGFTSGYFDCDGYSLLQRASRAGCPVIGIDRPGYGKSTRLPPGDGAIPRNAELLQAVIARLWDERDVETTGVVLVGHSIGSTISLYLAGQPTGWPLLGVSFSGLLVSARTDVPPFWKAHDSDEWIHTPAKERMSRMFGPPGTYVPRALAACDGLSEPVWWREIVECYIPWEDDFAEVCSRVRVPVQHRQGEMDPIWANGPDEMRKLAEAFTGAPSVDSRSVPNSGHCIDFHLAGKALHNEQIEFARRCAAGSIAADFR